ncbi:MAG: cobalamin-binding protein [Pseudomonas sp.]|nr:cobalamin-binding protein [Pseudomonas sp.]
MMVRWLLVVLLVLGGPAAAAQRVVSLAPSLTEIVTQLGAQDQLVGVLDAGDRPAGLERVASVGRYGQLNIEALLSLKPDLLLLWPGSVSPAQRDQLQRLGIPIFVSEPHSLDELADQIEAIGLRLGHPVNAHGVASDVRQRLVALRQHYRRDVPLRVFYQVWDAPLYTLGGRQIISDALRACGGVNVFAELTLPAPQVSIEAVLQRDPQVILVAEPTQVAAWARWPQVAAVREGRVWLREAALERPSGGMIAAVERLCRRMGAVTTTPGSR